ncbi:MAG TPA: hypothetical protein VG916_02855 [Gemmatimonadaceae bacterium]|nr:hypothetical protein [Gemmatimonadaceae bacterium]
MTIRRIGLVFIAAATLAAGAGAQDSSARRTQVKETPAGVAVRTFMLRYMNPDDAAKLVTPYVDYTPFGGVYSAGNVHGITVRGMPAVLARVDSLLKANDLEPESVKLSFQVIAAYDSVVRDTSVAAIERELRSVLRYAGYRSIATGSMITGQGVSETSLSAGSWQLFPIGVNVERIDRAGGTVRFNISMRAAALSAGSGGAGSTSVLSTGLSVPFGQSVVVGTGAPLRLPMMGPSDEGAGQRALILVVRADLAKRP